MERNNENALPYEKYDIDEKLRLENNIDAKAGKDEPYVVCDRIPIIVD